MCLMYIWDGVCVCVMYASMCVLCVECRLCESKCKECCVYLMCVVVQL